MIFLIVPVCFLNVLFRSSLNVIDRFLFGKRFLGFFYLYFFSISLPCMIGVLFLLFLGALGSLWSIFLSPSCFLLAISTHLVGLSFSYAFRYYEVKQVILRAKLPELFLPLLLLIPFWTNENRVDQTLWKTMLPLVVTWLGILPLAFRNETRSHFFDKSTLFVCGSLFLQMFFSSFVAVQSSSYSETIALATGILLWRFVFTLPFCIFKMENAAEKQNVSSRLIKVLLFRSFVSFGTLLTFTWCILEGSPILIWPILNMTPLVAAAVSHLILKEKVSFAEQFALFGFFLGTSLTLVL